MLLGDSGEQNERASQSSFGGETAGWKKNLEKENFRQTLNFAMKSQNLTKIRPQYKLFFLDFFL